jgi:FMN phosphatase YigB (HAD superfamily)
VFSGLEGVEKPDTRIYEIALERAGVAPEEVLHTGDSMRKDYVPAKNVGMHALLLDREDLGPYLTWVRLSRSCGRREIVGSFPERESVGSAEER